MAVRPRHVNVDRSFRVTPPGVSSLTHDILPACALSADGNYFITTAVTHERRATQNRDKSAIRPIIHIDPVPYILRLARPYVYDFSERYPAPTDCSTSPVVVRRVADAHLIQTFDKLSSYPTACSLTGDGTVAAASCSDGSVTLWNAQTAHPLAKISAHGNYVHDLAITPDGATLATIDEDTAKCWHSATMSCLLTHSLPPLPSARTGDLRWHRNSCSLIADVNTVYVTGMFGVQAVDVRTGKTSVSVSNAASMRSLLRGPLVSAAASRDGRVVVTCHIWSADVEQIRVWDLRMRRPRQTIGLQLSDRHRCPNYGRTLSITPDGCRVVAGGTVCDTSRGMVSHLFEDREWSTFPLEEPIQGVVSADGKTLVFVGSNEDGYVCSLEGSETNVLETMDIGPPRSRVPLGSEIERVYASYLNGGCLPSLNVVAAALNHTEAGYAVQTMTDVYCAHVLVRTLQGNKCELQAECLPMQEEPLRFLWRTVYLKMAAAAGDRDQHRELARRIMCDAREHGLLTESNFDVLLFGLHVVQHFSQSIADVRGAMRDVYKQLSWRLSAVERAVDELVQAAESDKRMTFVRFGLALVPVVGGACAALADVTGDVLLSLDCDAVVDFLSGNFAALGALLVEIRGARGRSSGAELELAALAYSAHFIRVLAGANAGAKQQLERMAVHEFGSVGALRAQLSDVLSSPNQCKSVSSCS